MKKVILLSTLFLIGAGCSSAIPEEVEINEFREMIPENTELNPNEVPKTGTKPTVEKTSEEKFKGAWNYSGTGTYIGGVEANVSVGFNIDIKKVDSKKFGADKMLKGTFVATLSTPEAPAMRISAGELDGYLDGIDVYEVEWYGDDGEGGRAYLKYMNDTLVWDVTYNDPSGRDFTLGDMDAMVLLK